MKKAILGNRIYITVEGELTAKLKKDLTYRIPPRSQFDNPIVIRNYKALKPGLASIPSGREDLIPDDYEIIDKRISVPAEFPEFKFTLRPSQQEILDEIDSSAMINAKVSFGKTFVGLAIAGKLKQKMLVITHTTVLRNQWVKEVEKVFGFTPGIIGSGQFDTSTPIVVANIQTLVKKIPQVSKKFGAVVLDECLDYQSSITTRDGEVAIGKIVNQKLTVEVLSLNETSGKTEWKRVVNWYKNPQSDPMIKFTFNDKSKLKCTLNHTIYSLNKGKVQAEYLEEGDWVVAAKSFKASNLLTEDIKDTTALQITDIDFEYASYGNRFNIEVEDNHNYFAGHKLVSNCHHTSATTFSKVVDSMWCKYKIGLSGTIKRKDGKHIVFQDYFGAKLFQPPPENSMTPTVKVVKSVVKLPDAIPWASKMTSIGMNEVYQDEVVALAAMYANVGHKVLLVSDRVLFLEACAEKLGKLAVCITGSVDEDMREALMYHVAESKDGSVLCGTQSIFSEGISLDALSCLILATPTNNEPLLAQLVGRIVRLKEDKLNPVVVDIVLKGSTSRNQARARRGFYMREGWQVTDVN